MECRRCRQISKNPRQRESAAAQDLLENDRADRAPARIDYDAPEASVEAPRKRARINPDAPASEPWRKQLSKIAGVIPACKCLASIVGVDEVLNIGKD